MTATPSIYRQSRGEPCQFVRGYLDQLAVILAAVDCDAVATCIARLDAARREGRTVFVAGNGGSAATASHIANDLLNLTYKCPGAVPGFRVVALTDNMAVFSAIANDDGYDQVFVRQLAALHRSGDVLVSVSASGNSPNLLVAAQWTRDHGGVNVGLLGFDGGQLLGLCDVAVLIRTDRGEYGFVEDTHMVMDHVITSWFQQHLQVLVSR